MTSPRRLAVWTWSRPPRERITPRRATCWTVSRSRLPVMKFPVPIFKPRVWWCVAFLIAVTASTVWGESLLETMDQEVSSIYEKSRDAVVKIHAQRQLPNRQFGAPALVPYRHRLLRRQGWSHPDHRHGGGRRGYLLDRLARPENQRPHRRAGSPDQSRGVEDQSRKRDADALPAAGRFRRSARRLNGHRRRLSL